MAGCPWDGGSMGHTKGWPQCMHGSVGKSQKRGVAVTQNVTTGSGGMLVGQNRVGWRGKIAHYAQDAKGGRWRTWGGVYNTWAPP